MKAMIPMNDYGILADKNNIARVDSRFIAQFFEKRHSHVIRDIQSITEPKSGLSKEFTKLNFELSSYKDSTGRKLPCYLLTRDGFTILAMGYTGPKAMKFKELYIKKFNEMEDFITTIISAKEMFPILTENITLIHDHPKAYHYSNECDMINRLVLGMSAKQVRELYGIEKGQSIRPYLTSGQMYLIDRLQKIDAGLLISTPDYQARKRQLEWYLTKISQEVLMSKTYKKQLENPNFRPLVYICAPYSSDKELNINKAIHYAELAYKNGAIPVTPHLLFPFMNDEDKKQRADALFMDIILLGKCQELWVFGDEITKGMKIELEIAKKRKQVIRYFTSEGLEVKRNAKF